MIYPRRLVRRGLSCAGARLSERDTICDNKSTGYDNFVDEVPARCYSRTKQKPLDGFADPSYAGRLATEWFLFWPVSQPPGSHGCRGGVFENDFLDLCAL